MAAIGSKPSFFIIYGWISGKGHGHKLKQLLVSAGYTVAKDAETADIIITHSAGFYLIPQKSLSKLIFIVGPTLNELTFSNWVHANIENARMFWHDRRVLRGFGLNILHLLDIVLRFKHNLRIARAARQDRMPLLHERPVVMVANQKDPWPRLPDLKVFMARQPWIFISMRGAHENIWEEPAYYVEIINHYAKRLLV